MASLATRSTPNNRPVGENTVGGSVEYRVASDDKSLFVEESTLGGSVVRRRSGSRCCSDFIIMIISCVCVEKKAKIHG